MGARVRYTAADGNTVPYPPLFDHIRRNHGFIDTRGRPDRIAEIPEAQESPGLTRLLQTLAAPDARLISLGCDLGQDNRSNSRAETRRIAGGYVQIVSARQLEPNHEFEFLGFVGRTIERELKAAARNDFWDIELRLCPVLLRIEAEVEMQSIWIWFHAKGPTINRAASSRERLLEALDGVVGNLQETLTAER